MKRLVVGNLKMNLSSALERERYLKLMEKELGAKRFSNCEIVLCPPFVHLEAFANWQKKKNITLGAQDVFSESRGSYTGEISPEMLKNSGCAYVILGHSERRRYFSENNHEINLKLIAALKNGLQPILCVGETKVEKNNQDTQGVITQQVKEGLQNIGRVKAKQIVIAYEPVWAVGTDKLPTTNEVMEAKLLIRKILVELFGKKYAEMTRILYGGSVSAKTAKQVCRDAGVDGSLVGRESLAPREFMKIAEIIDN